MLVSERQRPEGEKLEEVRALEEMGATVEAGGHSDHALRDADLIIVSPGIPPTADVIRRAQEAGKELISDVELAYRERGQTEIIGITGTNGKSTTCALVSYMLETCGFSAPACGNFGIPILGQLEAKPDYLVAEVSSYQLHYSPTFAPSIGIWSNLTPDHLDWHGGLNAYVAAKQKMFLNQRTDQYAVLNDDDPVVANFQPPSEIFPFSVYQSEESSVQAAYIHEGFLCYRIDGASRIVCGRDELKIIGDHNMENALAAISVAAILRLDHEKLVQALTTFRALEHRLEYVATIDGVDFYNDSKATNPTSTIKALEAFGERKIVLIAGGRDKGTSLAELIATSLEHVSELVLLGEAKARFEAEFRAGGFNNIHAVNTLEEAIDLGQSLKKGPVVLSPACASFDMFKDYEHRGRAFKELVNERARKVAPSK